MLRHFLCNAELCKGASKGTDEDDEDYKEKGPFLHGPLEHVEPLHGPSQLEGMPWRALRRSLSYPRSSVSSNWGRSWFIVIGPLSVGLSVSRVSIWLSVCLVLRRGKIALKLWRFKKRTSTASRPFASGIRKLLRRLKEAMFGVSRGAI